MVREKDGGFGEIRVEKKKKNRGLTQKRKKTETEILGQTGRSFIYPRARRSKTRKEKKARSETISLI